MCFRTLLKFAALAIFLMFFTAQYLSAQDWGDIEEWEKVIQPPAEFADEPAMVLFDKGEMRIDISGMTFIRHVRIKVFDKDNVGDIASVDISYYENDKFSKFKAHTILPNGNKKEVKDKFEKKANHYKTLTFTFPAITDGSILEYQYKIFKQGISSIEPWYFQNPAYTLKSIFSVTLAPGFTYNARVSNLPYHLQNPKKETVREFSVVKSKFMWEVDSLAPARSEPLAGAVSNYKASLHFQLRAYKDRYNDISFMPKWEDIGKGMSKSINESFAESEKLPSLAVELTAGAASLEDTITGIYDFVRDSIWIDETGRRSYYNNDFDRLIEERAGFAIQKNLLLVGLLRECGLNANPFLIGTRGFCNLNPKIVQMSQFNHLICHLGLGDKTYVLDTGERSVVYPYVPSYDLVKAGLLVVGDSSRISNLPLPPERKSSIQLNAVINLHESGSAVCSTFICVQGYENAEYDEYLMDTVSQQQIATGMLEEVEFDYEVHEAVTGYYPEGDSLSIQMVVEFPEFGLSLGNTMLINPCLLPLIDNPFDSDKRQFPVDFQYEYVHYHQVTINLPENMTVADLPVNITRKNDCGKYMRSFMSNGNSIASSLYFKLNKATFLPQEYDGLKELFDEVSETSTDQIALMVAE
ncbi:MAG: DUF3857 domain-containing protein [candidate division Zixibacteria bacterium]|nr:DUF3857 domain-containing protein [candidate division Zixibacteria bacterium]